MTVNNTIDELLTATGRMDAATNCTELGGNQWIWDTFGECVYGDVRWAGFIIGMISIVLWIVPMVPQLAENYRRKSCEGLSVGFLLFWIIGDSMNLLGAYLTRQLAFQVGIACYYIVADIILLSQYTYYTHLRARCARLKFTNLSHSGSRTSSTLIVSCVAVICTLTTAAARTDNLHAYTQQHELQFFADTRERIGYILGSLSAVSYFCGRVPQLYKNYVRQSTQGMSMPMFIIIILANGTYGVSVLLSDPNITYMLHHAPWLVGSLGCCALDVLVIGQYFRYRNMPPIGGASVPADDEDNQRLLDDTDDERA